MMYRVLSLYLENRELCSMTTTLLPRGCVLYVSGLSAAPVARGCLEPPVQALPSRARAHMASFAVNDKCWWHRPGGGLRRLLACLQLLGLLSLLLPGLTRRLLPGMPLPGRMSAGPRRGLPHPYRTPGMTIVRQDMFRPLPSCARLLPPTPPTTYLSLG